jgi:hypothetical protein
MARPADSVTSARAAQADNHRVGNAPPHPTAETNQTQDGQAVAHARHRRIQGIAKPKGFAKPKAMTKSKTAQTLSHRQS